MSARQTLRVTFPGGEHETVDVPARPAEIPGVSAGAHTARVTELTAQPPERSVGQRRFEVVVDGWRFELVVEPVARAELRQRAARSGTRASSGGAVVVHARIPGRVVRVWVAPGDDVEAGERLLSVEAMKMENDVTAPRGGTVAAIHRAVGQVCEAGDPLVTLA